MLAIAFPKDTACVRLRKPFDILPNLSDQLGTKFFFSFSLSATNIRANLSRLKRWTLHMNVVGTFFFSLSLSLQSAEHNNNMDNILLDRIIEISNRWFCGRIRLDALATKSHNPNKRLSLFKLCWAQLFFPSPLISWKRRKTKHYHHDKFHSVEIPLHSSSVSIAY